MVVHIVTFWKSRGVHPRNHVPNLKPRILDAHGHAVLGPGASERQQVAARLEYAQALSPYFHAGHVVVPALAHEAQAIRRVGDNGVDAAVRHAAQGS